MAKCACSQCSQLIEYPDEMAGASVQCPTCGKETRLSSTDGPVVRIPTTSPLQTPERAESRSGVAAIANQLMENVEKVIIGKREEITLAMVAFFSEGHILLEDVPGVAKTMLARSIAQSVGGVFKRIQCTPDLLPTDAVGASIYKP